MLTKTLVFFLIAALYTVICCSGVLLLLPPAKGIIVAWLMGMLGAYGAMRILWRL